MQLKLSVLPRFEWCASIAECLWRFDCFGGAKSPFASDLLICPEWVGSGCVAGTVPNFPGEPVLGLDVAHNVHSVAALTENLKSMGRYRFTHAVFGAMSDKDLIAMFSSFAELIGHWYFTDLPLPRASSPQDLAEIWRDMKYDSKAKSSVFESPEVALAAAIQAANLSDRILIFGSFYSVGGVLQHVSIGNTKGLEK